MPEYPEIHSRAREMKLALVTRSFTNIEVVQPRCLNLPKTRFIHELVGAKVLDVGHKGKWLMVETTKGWLLLNLGMGGELLLVTRATLPKKYRLLFDLDDGSCFAVNFWWFGYAHYVAMGELDRHEMTARLGPNALPITVEDLGRMISGRRGGVKSFLIDQSNIAGIGNAYVHDILFLARLHPLRTLDTLSTEDVTRLAEAIHKGLQPSADKGGAFYEVNIHGQGGGFTGDDILIGYKEGKDCPNCGTKIEKIKTGGTSSFICPQCQKLS